MNRCREGEGAADGCCRVSGFSPHGRPGMSIERGLEVEPVGGQGRQAQIHSYHAIGGIHVAIGPCVIRCRDAWTGSQTIHFQLWGDRHGDTVSNSSTVFVRQNQTIGGCGCGCECHSIHQKDIHAIQFRTHRIPALPAQNGAESFFDGALSSSKGVTDGFLGQRQVHIRIVAAVHVLGVQQGVGPRGGVVVAVLGPIHPLPTQCTCVAVVVQTFVLRIGRHSICRTLDEELTDEHGFVELEIGGLAREGRITISIIVEGVEVERAVGVATSLEEAVVAVIVHLDGIACRVNVRHRGRIHDPRGHFRRRIGAFDGTGRLVDEFLDVQHWHMAVEIPSELVRHAFRLIENLPSENGFVAFHGVDHRDEGILDVALTVGLLRENGKRPVGIGGAVGDAQHVEGPQAQQDGDVVRFGHVQQSGQILDGG